MKQMERLMNKPIMIPANKMLQGSEEWLQWRTKGIGGTDAAAITGVSKWDTPLSIYAKKIGKAPKQDKSKYQEWGNRIEPLLVQKHLDEHKGCGHEVQCGNMYYDAEEQWMKASLDAQIDDLYIIECKTARSAAEWDPVPDGYYAQAQWQMLVSGMRKVWFSVLVGGVDWFEVEIDYNHEFCMDMYVKCKKFYEDWQAGIPPGISEHGEKDVNALMSMHPSKEEGSSSAVDLDTTEYARFILARENLDKAQSIFDREKAALVYKMGNSNHLCFDGKTVATFIQRKGTDTIDKTLLKQIAPDIYNKVLKPSGVVSYVKFS